MRIDGTANPLAPGAAAADNGKGLRNEFLNLLVAQLEHQNPLDPTEGSEFVAQLAQLTSVEQAAESNKRLAAIESQQAASLGASLASFVGSKATAQIEGFRWDPSNGGAPDLSINVGADTASTKVTIVDSTGAPVRSFDLGARQAGQASLAWDGKDAAGVPLERGTYRIQIEAKTKDGTEVPAAAQLAGIVDAIEASGGAYYLRIGGASITPSEIVSLGRDTSTVTTTTALPAGPQQ